MYKVLVGGYAGDQKGQVPLYAPGVRVIGPIQYMPQDFNVERVAQSAEALEFFHSDKGSRAGRLKSI